MQQRYFIDAVSARGMTGWAVGTHPNDPCRLRIERAGSVVTRAVARGFRRDLLAAGIGHGHYAFTARFAAPLPPGEHRFTLFDAESGAMLPGNAAEVLTTTDLEASVPTRLEDLLERGDHWTEADLVEHIAVLRLEANMRAMGIPRYVDVGYRYVQNRWPDREGADAFERALREREISADEFLRILILSEERKQIRTPLASPYDAEFPYDLACAE